MRSRAWFSLVLLGALTLAACSDRQPADPEHMQLQVGRRAFKFYQALNQGRWDDAGLFLSPRLRERYPDPRQEPLIAGRASGSIGRLMPSRPQIDWRHRRATIEVTVHEPVRRPDGTYAMTLKDKQRHRWIELDGVWYYDGIERAE